MPSTGKLKDLIIGDDWRMAVGVVLLLALVAAADAGWVTWWLPRWVRQVCSWWVRPVTPPRAGGEGDCVRLT